MKRITKFCLAVALLLGVAVGAQTPQDAPFAVGDQAFMLHGEPFLIKAAEVHYPRIPRPYWEHRIKMCKALGMNTLCFYVFWNIHEQREGVFDFEGQNDVAEFCRIAQRNGMYIIVRPGHTSAPSGRWAACRGGCSRRKTSGCASATRISWSASGFLSARSGGNLRA